MLELEWDTSISWFVYSSKIISPLTDTLKMGVIISSAVLPATLTLLWKDQNTIAAALSPILGLVVSLIAWLVTAKKECGKLDVDCTGSK